MKMFNLEKKGTSIRTEIIAGITTFLAMAYILPVNSFMLGETGMPVAAVFLATALSAAIASIIMGLYANYPVALAPGMGVNAFFTYTVVLFGYGFTWQEALSAVLVSGVIFLIISVTGLRRKIIDAIPLGLKYAVGAGIGFFITFIGLKNAGIIVSNPATFVGLGELTHPTVALAVIGLVITVVLYARKVKSAIFIGIVATTIIGLVLGMLGVSNMPAYTGGDLGDLGAIKTTFGVAFMHLGKVLTTKEGWMAIFTFLFIDFFDTAGTLMAVGTQANLLDKEGKLVDGGKALMADSVGTVAGAVLGTSTVTSYIESSAGIETGGRTGLTSVVVGFLFLLSIVAYPLLSVVNGVFIPESGIVLSPVTSPALIMVGALMITSLRNIDWNDIAITISTFFTVIFMLLTFSIAEGIAIGFIFYPILMLATKRGKDVNPIMYGLMVLFILKFIFM